MFISLIFSRDNTNLEHRLDYDDVFLAFIVRKLIMEFRYRKLKVKKVEIDKKYNLKESDIDYLNILIEKEYIVEFIKSRMEEFVVIEKNFEPAQF